MLEGLDWSNAEIRVPASLILLIRHQLGPLRGDLHEEFSSREARNNAAWGVAQRLKPDQKLSINLLVKLVTSREGKKISRATAERWLRQKGFHEEIKEARRSLEILRKGPRPD
jgi:hypothetical protein